MKEEECDSGQCWQHSGMGTALQKLTLLEWEKLELKMMTLV